jgi:hypothetical protein
MSTRQRLENGLFFLGYLVRDIGKQQRMEWQQLFALKASTQPDDAPSTPKSSQHFGERQTMEKTNNLFSDSTQQWSTRRLVKSHGNQLVLRSPWQPFASSLATAFHGPSLYRSPSDLGPGDAAEEL